MNGENREKENLEEEIHENYKQLIKYSNCLLEKIQITESHYLYCA